MANEKKKCNKGGPVSMFETSNMKEINASLFIKKSFEDVGCLGFCERIQKVGFHTKFTSLFSTNFRRDEITIEWMDFMLSAEVIGMSLGF